MAKNIMRSSGHKINRGVIFEDERAIRFKYPYADKVLKDYANVIVDLDFYLDMLKETRLRRENNESPDSM